MPFQADHDSSLLKLPYERIMEFVLRLNLLTLHLLNLKTCLCIYMYLPTAIKHIRKPYHRRGQTVHYIDAIGIPFVVDEYIQNCARTILYRMIYGKHLNLEDNKQFKLGLENPRGNIGSSFDIIHAVESLTFYRLLKGYSDIRFISFEMALDHFKSFDKTHIRDVTDAFIAEALQMGRIFLVTPAF